MEGKKEAKEINDKGNIKIYQKLNFKYNLCIKKEIKMKLRK